jgi:hypothetical protein
MDAEDWLKGVKKKLVIAQCTDREKVLFAAHQLYGTAANWWETYCNQGGMTGNEYLNSFILLSRYPLMTSTQTRRSRTCS